MKKLNNVLAKHMQVFIFGIVLGLLIAVSLMAVPLLSLNKDYQELQSEYVELEKDFSKRTEELQILKWEREMENIREEGVQEQDKWSDDDE